MGSLSGMTVVLADSPVTEDDHPSSECHDRQGDLNWLCN